MAGDVDAGSLERLLDERGQHLLRAAVALAGSRADGEDLLQAALERLVRNWHRVQTDPEGYLRRTCITWPPMAGVPGAGGGSGWPSSGPRPWRSPAAGMSRR